MNKNYTINYLPKGNPSHYLKSKTIKTVLLFLLFIVCGGNRIFAQADTFSTASSTGVTYTVPAGVTVVGVNMTGACGGNSTTLGPNTGSVGGQVICTYSVTPGGTLYVYVGGMGASAAGATGGAALAGGVGATPGGVGGTSTSAYNGGGGGGSSAIRVGGTAKTNTVLEAAGGAGGSGHNTAYQSQGGVGNGPDGGNGAGSSVGGNIGGFGGTQTAGGYGGGSTTQLGASGSATSGGAGWNGGTFDGGGGGGGGWYGGGGGGGDSTSTIYASGGGGGSNYVGGAGVLTVTTNDSSTAGCGNGRVIICAYPNPGAVAGTATVCVGGTVALTNTTSTGTSSVWATSSATIATVSATGVVTGITTGTVTITFTSTNACGSLSTTYNMVVNQGALIGSITGGTAVCLGSTITLADDSTGGTWSLSNTHATITTGGVVTGSSIGTDTATYIYTHPGTGCKTDSTKVITVSGSSTVAAITGTSSSVCVSGLLSLTETTTGGTWSSYHTSTATVGTSGIVTGVAAGADTIKYVVGAGTACADSSTYPITVIALPSHGTISGGNTICSGGSLTLTSTSTGGTWASLHTTIATVGASTGIVTPATGVTNGLDTIRYTVTNSCGSSDTLYPIVISSTPSAGVISGTDSVCVGSTVSLTSSETAGVAWTSSNPAIATVGPATGVVTGVATGTVDITTTVTTSCGVADTFVSFKVNALATVSGITGTLTVCAGGTTTLANTTTGGTWRVTNANATVSSSGVVTGVTAGTDSVYYSITNSCGTSSTGVLVTIEPTPSAGSISGTTPLCAGSAASDFTETLTGGTWSSSNTGVATITSGGAVSAVSAGSTVISYSFTNSCGISAATYDVSVIAAPTAGTITASSATVCTGSTLNLGENISGGTWTSSNPAIATVSSGGVVTGLTTGSFTITYAVTTTCGNADTTINLTVSTVTSPGLITGITSLCTGVPQTYTDPATGGTWSSTNTSVATVSSSGVVTPLTVGTTIISYTTSSSCGNAAATADVTVNATPFAGAISGSSLLCVGSGETLTETASGGTWSSVYGYATVNSSGVAVGVSAGVDTIKYTVTTVCGTAVAVFALNVAAPGSAGVISGPSTVCTGSTSTLSETATGGTWTSSNSTLALVSPTGVVTGVAAGSVIISYAEASSCGVNIVTYPMTVNLSPNAGSISGGSIVCTGSGLLLTESVSDGTWSSSNVSVASISTSGLVTGVASGVATITYAVTNSCGTAITTENVTVNASSTVGTLTGPTVVCTGTTITLSDATGGGTWSSSNTLVASVSTEGVVSGVAAGSAIITYAITSSCGSVISTLPITVNLSPSAGSISGLAAICTGTSITLTDATTGGVWSSSNPTVASVSSTGVVTGVASGTVDITYAVTNSCGTAVASQAVTISADPSTGSISGAGSVCAGNDITLSESASGGVWSSSNPAVATVSSTGVVSGISGGIVTITYEVAASCGSFFTTDIISITGYPNAGVILGTPEACLGSTTILADTVLDGVWSSGNTSIATVSTSGIVTGVGVGTVNVYYTVTGACGSTNATVSVNVASSVSAGTISGVGEVCVASNMTLTDPISGGTWTSSNTSIATVNSDGVVTGVSDGSVLISYTVTNGCGTAMTTTPMTVTNSATAGTISGPSDICPGHTFTLTDPISGGSWSSSNTTVASISSTGVITPVSLGTAVITYLVSTTCGTAISTLDLTVSSTVLVSPITGSTNVCLGYTTTLSDVAGGGTWISSDPSVAAISSTGIVTGLTLGTSIISYQLTSSSCGTGYATTTVTVGTTPNEGVIVGITTFCAGTTTSLTETVSGGTWSSGTPSVATVNSVGLVTGVAGGSDIITYTVSDACGTSIATADLTVEPLASTGVITGHDSVCLGGNMSLADTAGGGSGIWLSGNTAVAVVTTSGMVSGISTGSTIIYYGLTNSCGTSYASVPMDVVTLPVSAGVILGPTTVCPGTTGTLTDAVTGGSWISSDTTIAKVNSAGVVTGVAAGVVTITYAVSDVCGSVYEFQTETVNPSPDSGAIAGVSTVVCPQATITFTDASAGGVWSSSDNSIATVNSAGIVTGVSNGTVNISYTVSNACGSASTLASVYVNPAPVITSIFGATSMCQGSTIDLLEGTLGGTWSSTNSSISSVNSSGVVTGINAGVDSILYSVSNSFGCVGSAIIPDTVHVMPSSGTITAATTVVCQNATITLSETSTAGVWSSSDAAIATVSAAGVVTGVLAGTSTISYTASNEWCSSSTSVPVNVNPAPVLSPISGSNAVCEYSTITLSDVFYGGTWSSSNNVISTATPTTGIVYGVSDGVDTISYSLSNAYGCISTVSITDTVRPTPGAGVITATVTTVCPNDSILLTDAITGGFWVSANTSIATVNSATGYVTGVDLAGGATTVYYGISNGSCTAYDSVTVNVNPAPNIGPIVGATKICDGSAVSLTDSVYGGSWVSSDTTIETITPTSGVVIANAIGNATIYYTVTNVLGCTSTVSVYDTVIVSPFVSAITGLANVCQTYSIALHDGTASGTWSSSNATVASVTATGHVTGANVGSAVIFYTITSATGCNGVASHIVNVNPNPSVGLITGNDSVCTGATTTLYDDSTGGVWKSLDTALASIDNTLGTVIGNHAGLDSIIYTVYNTYGCSATIGMDMTVNPSPTVAEISGPNTVCLGSTASLSETTTGGTWSSSNATIASISPAGTVTGLTVGSAIISYTVYNSYGCLGYTEIMDSVVNLPSVDAITGTTYACIGASTSLADSTTGGTWSSGDVTVATINSVTGVASGIAAGSTNMIYTVFNGSGCSNYASAAYTVIPGVSAGTITGTSELCPGTNTLLTETTSGGTWSTTDSSVATITAVGLVTGVGKGLDTIVYTVSGSGCPGYDSFVVSVDTLAGAAILPVGGASICHGSPVNLVVNTTGTGYTYQWLRNDTVISGSTSSSYVADSAGSYSVEIIMGTCNVILAADTIVGQPNPSIGLDHGDILFTGSYSTYQWMFDSTIIPGATSSTYIETALGYYQVIVTNMYGCVDTSGDFWIFPLGVNNVNNGVMNVSLYPNPTTSEIHVDAADKVNVRVTTIDGKELMYVKQTNSINMSDLANGVYMIMVYNKEDQLILTSKVVKME